MQMKRTNHNMIDVVSAGPGNEDLLTIQARKILDEAQVVFCARRNENLVASADKRRPLTPFSAALEEMETLRKSGLRIAVLLSGDAGLYSLLPVLEEHFGPDALRVCPGISSLQAFCARLCIPWQESRILSAHGRELTPSALCDAVRNSRITLLLLDGDHDPQWIRRSLDDGGLNRAIITVGERISYPDEQIGPFEDREYDPLCIALIRNNQAEKTTRVFGLPDDAFARGKTPMTKKEIRVQIASELNLPRDAIVWDIGAGTGSVTVECALQCPLGEVYAVDKDPDTLGLISENIQRFALQNVHVVSGNAPGVLESLPVPTHVFLGGTGGNGEQIISLLDQFGKAIRLCGTAVTMESMQEYFHLLRNRKDFSAIQVAVSRVEPVGDYHMLRAGNPVFVFSAEVGS